MNQERAAPSMGAMVITARNFASLLCASLVACSGGSSTSTTSPAADGGDDILESDAAAIDAPTDAAAASDDDGATDAALPEPAMVPGMSGESCATACAAAGKACVVACKDHRSCGGHDGEPPPYAGYACYYRETGSGGNKFRSNDGRSLIQCDEIASTTWDNSGSEYTLGDYLGNNPVSCCCQ